MAIESPHISICYNPIIVYEYVYSRVLVKCLFDAVRTPLRSLYSTYALVSSRSRANLAFLSFPSRSLNDLLAGS